jgi:hypothetical protein
VAISIAAAVALFGGGATVGELARRLRCGVCGGRRITVQIGSDPRPAETRQRDHPPSEARAGPPVAETIAALARDPERLHQRVRAALAETWQMSPLGVWLTEHHDEVARLLRGHSAPPWDRLAAGFTAACLLDARRRKPDAETTRHLGSRLRRPASPGRLERHAAATHEDDLGLVRAHRPLVDQLGSRTAAPRTWHTIRRSGAAITSCGQSCARSDGGRGDAAPTGAWRGVRIDRIRLLSRLPGATSLRPRAGGGGGCG